MTITAAGTGESHVHHSHCLFIAHCLEWRFYYNDCVLITPGHRWKARTPMSRKGTDRSNFLVTHRWVSGEPVTYNTRLGPSQMKQMISFCNTHIDVTLFMMSPLNNVILSRRNCQNYSGVTFKEQSSWKWYFSCRWRTVSRPRASYKSWMLQWGDLPAVVWSSLPRRFRCLRPPLCPDSTCYILHNIK